jgi:hypothetical protein
MTGNTQHHTTHLSTLGSQAFSPSARRAGIADIFAQALYMEEKVGKYVEPGAQV